MPPSLHSQRNMLNAEVWNSPQTLVCRLGDLMGMRTPCPFRGRTRNHFVNESVQWVVHVGVEVERGMLLCVSGPAQCQKLRKHAWSKRSRLVICPAILWPEIKIPQ